MKLLFLLLLPLVYGFCPANYTYSSQYNKCYTVYEILSTYLGAVQKCSSDGAQLVTINNQFENLYVASIIPDQFGIDHWIGLTKQGISGNWSWMDGSNLIYSNWKPGEPASGAQCGTLMEVTNQWEAKDCTSTKLPFICAYDLSKYSCPTTTQKTATPHCDDGWSYYSKTDSCYARFFWETWQAAENACVNKGAHLTSIHSYDENMFVINLAKTGMHDVNDNNEVWIGGSRSCSSCDLHWTDGSPWSYTYWGPKEPGYSSRPCVELFADEYNGLRGEWENQWMMYDCTDQHRAYICKKPAYH